MSARHTSCRCDSTRKAHKQHVRRESNRKRSLLRQAIAAQFETLEGRQLLSGSYGFNGTDTTNSVVWLTASGSSNDHNTFDPGSLNTYCSADHPSPACTAGGSGGSCGSCGSTGSTGNCGSSGCATSGTRTASASMLKSLSYTAPNPKSTSSVGIRDGDGLPLASTTDLQSTGSTAWGVTRTWSATLNNGVVGNRWNLNDLPHLVQSSYNTTTLNGTVVAIDSGSVQRWFDEASGVFTARFYTKDLLTYDSSSGTYTITDSTGGQTKFTDFNNAATYKRGQFVSYTDPDGNVTQVAASGGYDGSGRILKVERTVGGITETFENSYDANGRIYQIEQKQAGVLVRRASYAYFASGDSWGNVGDLRTAAISDGTLQKSVSSITRGGTGNLTATLTTSTAHGYATGDTIVIAGATQAAYNGTFVVTVTSSTTLTYTMSSDPGATATGTIIADKPFDVSYYRYYTSNTAPGYTGGLKLVFNPQSYARMRAASVDPFLSTTLDATVDDYADAYYEYDSSKHVTKAIVAGAGCSVCSGGFGTYQYQYAVNPDADPNPSSTDYNFWRYRTVEILPDSTSDDSDNDRLVSYTNEVGELMLQSYTKMLSAQTVSSITRGGTGNLTATVTSAAAHGYSVGDRVAITGATQAQYNGLFTIASVPTSTTFTYTLASDPGASAAGTIKASKAGSEWIDFYKYASPGQMILHASPSAVTGYDELDNNGNLMVLSGSNYTYISDSVGLITETNYAASTSGTISETVVGDVAGQFKSSTVRHGETGTAITTKSVTYKKRVDSAGNIVYPIAEETSYPNTNGSGALTTSYAYTYFAGTTQIRSATITRPSVSVANNGSGTSAVERTVFDSYGRIAYTIDAEGYVNEYQYDSVTGAMTKSVVDSETPYPAYVLAEGPVGYWRLGENSGTTATDFSNSGRDGTYQGGYTLGATGGMTGDSDKSVTLNGSTGKVNVPNHTTLAITGDISIVAWVKVTDRAGHYGIVGKTSTNLPGSYDFYVQQTTGKPVFYRGNGAGGLFGSVTATSAVAADGAWHMVAITMSGTTVSHYLDGASNGSGTLSTTIADAGTDLKIGNRADGATPFKGDIDEVALFSRALASDRVQALYDAGRGTIAGRTGLSLTTSMEVDGRGRTTKLTDPVGNITYTTYNDNTYETRTYRGWDTATNTPTGPTEVMREDRINKYTETLTMSATPTVNSGRPTGTEAIASVLSLSRQYVNDAGQLIAADRYESLPSGYSTTPPANRAAAEAAGAYRTEYAYDSRGKLKRIQDSIGTVTWMLYDGLNRLSSTWIGTNDTGAVNGDPTGGGAVGNNMKKVSENEYDSVGVGDSNLTKTTQHPTGATSSTYDRVSAMFYDWRNRLVASKGGVQGTEGTSVQRMINYRDLDNMGRATATYQYDGDNITISDGNGDGVPDQPSSSLLRAKSTAEYDERGRLFRSQTFSVDPSTGSVSSSSLVSAQWYDLRGNLIKSQQPGASLSKSQFDGAGRRTKQFSTDGGGDPAVGATGNWDAADDVVGDVVLQQAETQYDADGNVIRTISKQRFHTETATGELGDASTTPKARVTYGAVYYDSANRATLSLNAGTNGGSAHTRATPQAATSATGTTITDSTRSDATGAFVGYTLSIVSGKGAGQSRTVSAYNGTTDTFTVSLAFFITPDSTSKYVLSLNELPTAYRYDSAGRLQDVTDPRGLVTRNSYDMLGRTTQTIAGYTDGTPSTADDQTTQYTYDGEDHILTLKAVLPSSAFQTTQYIYGVTASGGSDIASNNLLAEVRYPDKSTGNPGTASTDKQVFTYNGLGQQKTMTDQNGTVHTFSYDVLGRITDDYASTLATGIDTTVRRHQTSYGSNGKVSQVASLDNAGTTTLNSISYTYNGLGQVTQQAIARSGATTRTIYYTYSEMASGANHSRLIKVTYPNGRYLHYSYDLSEKSVSSITYSAGVATVNSTGHGYSAGDKVVIVGASVAELNGVVTVATASANSFTYVPNSTPSGGASNSGITAKRWDLDEMASRVSYLADDNGSGAIGTHLEEYSYLGLGGIIERNRPQADTKMTYYLSGGSADAGDQYVGLDRFGRVTDQRWLTASTSTDIDRYQYAYDRDSNRVSRDVSGTSNPGTLDEYYTYDSLNRLMRMNRGTLSSGTIADASSNYYQSYTLDALGNWSSASTPSRTPTGT